MSPRRPFFASALALLASMTALRGVAAQTSTDCNPLEKDCPADPALGMDYSVNFNTTPSSDVWETTVRPVTFDSINGATFIISKQGESPTIRSKFYYFFGRTEVWLKAAPGTGIVSSIMMLSDDLDEVDWELIGGNSTHAESNYFGKGRQDYGNAIWYPVTGGTQADFHNYTTVWTSSRLDFYIDGSMVRTLLPAEANSTNNYPQTPMRLSIGIWAGGDPTLSQGTREWAGGDTDYTKAPFSMYVKSVQVTDYSSGKEYTYGDRTGSYESIKITSGNSTAKDAITNPTKASAADDDESISDKFSKLSPVAKTAIFASAGGVAVVLAAWGLFYCIRRRRQGARDAKLAEARAEEERLEMERYKQAGINPDGLEAAPEYDPRNNSSQMGNVAAGGAVMAGAGAVNEKSAADAEVRNPLLQGGAQFPGSHGPITSPMSSPSPYMMDQPGAIRSPVPPVAPVSPVSPSMNHHPGAFPSQPGSAAFGDQPQPGYGGYQHDNNAGYWGNNGGYR